MVGKDKEVGKDERLPSSCRKVLEELAEVATDAIHRRLDSVVECPARNYEVVAHNEEYRHEAHSSEPAPATLDGGEGINGVALGVMTHRELRNKQGQTQEEDAAQVDKNEGATTVLRGDVAKPYSVS